MHGDVPAPELSLTLDAFLVRFWLMAMSDIELMRIEVDTLFVSDDDGRLRFINEPYGSGDDPAPSLFVGTTRLGSVVRFGSDLPNDLCQRIDNLIGDRPHVGDFNQMPSYLDAVMDLIGPHLKTGRMWTGPAYRFPKSIKATDLGVRVDSKNSHLLEVEFADYIPDLARIGPVSVVVENGKAVSICHSARLSADAEEAGVNTIPSCEGRGYATAAVACWARIVMEGGRIPLYSTSWDNLASQRVAQKLGLRMYGSHFHVS